MATTPQYHTLSWRREDLLVWPLSKLFPRQEAENDKRSCRATTMTMDMKDWRRHVWRCESCMQVAETLYSHIREELCIDRHKDAGKLFFANLPFFVTDLKTQADHDTLNEFMDSILPLSRNQQYRNDNLALLGFVALTAAHLSSFCILRALQEKFSVLIRRDIGPLLLFLLLRTNPIENSLPKKKCLYRVESLLQLIVHHRKFLCFIFDPRKSAFAQDRLASFILHETNPNILQKCLDCMFGLCYQAFSLERLTRASSEFGVSSNIWLERDVETEETILIKCVRGGCRRSNIQLVVSTLRRLCRPPFPADPISMHDIFHASSFFRYHGKTGQKLQLSFFEFMVYTNFKYIDVFFWDDSHNLVFQAERIGLQGIYSCVFSWLFEEANGNNTSQPLVLSAKELRRLNWNLKFSFDILKPILQKIFHVNTDAVLVEFIISHFSVDIQRLVLLSLAHDLGRWDLVGVFLKILHIQLPGDDDIPSTDAGVGVAAVAGADDDAGSGHDDMDAEETTNTDDDMNTDADSIDADEIDRLLAEFAGEEESVYDGDNTIVSETQDEGGASTSIHERTSRRRRRHGQSVQQQTIERRRQTHLSRIERRQQRYQQRIEQNRHVHVRTRREHLDDETRKSQEQQAWILHRQKCIAETLTAQAPYLRFLLPMVHALQRDFLPLVFEHAVRGNYVLALGLLLKKRTRTSEDFLTDAQVQSILDVLTPCLLTRYSSLEILNLVLSFLTQTQKISEYAWLEQVFRQALEDDENKEEEAEDDDEDDDDDDDDEEEDEIGEDYDSSISNDDDELDDDERERSREHARELQDDEIINRHVIPFSQLVSLSLPFASELRRVHQRERLEISSFCSTAASRRCAIDIHAPIFHFIGQEDVTIADLVQTEPVVLFLLKKPDGTGYLSTLYTRSELLQCFTPMSLFYESRQKHELISDIYPVYEDRIVHRLTLSNGQSVHLAVAEFAFLFQDEDDGGKQQLRSTRSSTSLSVILKRNLQCFILKQVSTVKIECLVSYRVKHRLGEYYLESAVRAQEDNLGVNMYYLDAIQNPVYEKAKS